MPPTCKGTTSLKYSLKDSSSLCNFIDFEAIISLDESNSNLRLTVKEKSVIVKHHLSFSRSGTLITRLRSVSCSYDSIIIVLKWGNHMETLFLKCKLQTCWTERCLVLLVLARSSSSSSSVLNIGANIISFFPKNKIYHLGLPWHPSSSSKKRREEEDDVFETAVHSTNSCCTYTAVRNTYWPWRW